MQKNHSFLALAILASAAVVGPVTGLTSCSSTQVHAEKATNADLTQYQRFSWAPAAQQEQVNPLSSRTDTILDQKIKTAVDQDLIKKGYVQNTQDAEVHVAYSLRTHDALTTAPGVYSPYGAGWTDGWDGYYDSYSYLQKEGSLVLDFIDAKTGKLLWRGVAVTDIKDTGVTQKQVQKFVDKIMEKFPSRIAATG